MLAGQCVFFIRQSPQPSPQKSGGSKNTASVQRENALRTNAGLVFLLALLIGNGVPCTNADGARHAAHPAKQEDAGADGERRGAESVPHPRNSSRTSTASSLVDPDISPAFSTCLFAVMNRHSANSARSSVRACKLARAAVRKSLCALASRRCPFWSVPGIAAFARPRRGHRPERLSDFVDTAGACVTFGSTRTCRAFQTPSTIHRAS